VTADPRHRSQPSPPIPALRPAQPHDSTGSESNHLKKITSTTRRLSGMMKLSNMS
jgi:hypothetical protein